MAQGGGRAQASQGSVQTGWNAMLRYKRTIGEALKARKMAGQATESRIAVRTLNRMTVLGAPDSVAVVA